MIGMIFRIVINLIRAAMMNRADLVIENAALRQQLAVLKDKHPRPGLRPADRVFWTALRSAWSRWADALIIVTPVSDQPSIVVVNPSISFGRPVLEGTGVVTSILAERYKAGDSLDALAEDYGRPKEEIEEAIRYEIRAA